MKPFFTAEDFNWNYPHLLTRADASGLANEKLARLSSQQGQDWEPFRKLGLKVYPSPILGMADPYVKAIDLKDLIESWPVVYGKFTTEGGMGKWPLNFNHHLAPDNTHTARLAFIQPIEPCKHEPTDRWKGPSTADWDKVCKHCGVELIAEWRERSK